MTPMMKDILISLFTQNTLFIFSQSYGVAIINICAQIGLLGVLYNKVVPATSSAEYEKGSDRLKLFYKRSSINQNSTTKLSNALFAPQWHVLQEPITNIKPFCLIAILCALSLLTTP